DADDDGGLEAVEQLQRARQRLEVAADDRVAGGVELRRSERRGQAAEQLVGELKAGGGGHALPSRAAASRVSRRRAVARCARAAERTPRDPWATASSSTPRASGVPMRASAAAAAFRSADVRRGAHHSPL